MEAHQLLRGTYCSYIKGAKRKSEETLNLHRNKCVEISCWRCRVSWSDLNMGQDQRVPLLRLRRGFLFDVSLEWNSSQPCPILLWCRRHYSFLSTFQESFSSDLFLPPFVLWNKTSVIVWHSVSASRRMWTCKKFLLILTAFIGAVQAHRREREERVIMPL